MISLLTRLWFGLGWAVLTTTASAELAVTPVTEQVYSAIGATQPPTYENRGHNNNLSFIITDEGVVVINGGDNYRLARDLHAEIRKLSNVPVRYVINENGQGHAFLGNSYWVEQGATIIAHALAVEKIRRHRKMRVRREAAGFRGGHVVKHGDETALAGHLLVQLVQARRRGSRSGLSSSHQLGKKGSFWVHL